MIPEGTNPAWHCPDCGTRLVQAETGWVCPRMHGGIVSDTLQARRLFDRSNGGTFDEWFAYVQKLAGVRQRNREKRK